MFEIGFRKIHWDEPVAGDHWASGKLHFFVHQNQMTPERKGVQLIVLEDRLFKEREKDDFILQADALFVPLPPSRPFLQKALGDSYLRLIDAVANTTQNRQSLARQTSRETLNLLGAAIRAYGEERGMLLLGVNGLVTKLSILLDNQEPGTSLIRHRLAAFGVKLGGQTHSGGLAYNQDLLWRVWRELPDSTAGELAFVELQQRGWNTSSGEGCPTNPDFFRDVIDRGEVFLSQHPSTQFRKEVLFTLAVANESWWSIAQAPAGDGWVAEIPYPRKAINRQQAAAARDRAISYYQRIIELAPESPEAASAVRRLPRLKQGLDTGQRRFFCSYC
jgi:hypothetical protein